MISGRSPSLFRAFCLILMVLTVSITGCGPDSWPWTEKQDTTTRPAGTIENTSAILQPSIALKGTVGEVTYVQGLRGMRVSGFSLVRGLAGHGSRTCPPTIREYIIREIRKLHSANPHSKPAMTAEQLIDSLDTAAVRVDAIIPFGMTKGRRFDVVVKTIDPEARLIAGSYLVACDLKIIKEVSPQQILEGKIHARARGPVFINPFSKIKDGESAVTVQEGTIIGGGVNLVDRRLGLIAVIESYSTVQQVTQAINRRFGSQLQVATAMGPNKIDLTMPPAFRGREKKFLDLIQYLPLTTSKAMLESRTNILIGELTRSESPKENIAQALQGIGRSVIPMLQRLYTDPRRDVSYYAAQTGLRLEDDLALEVIIQHAKDSRSPFRLQAIKQLGEYARPGRAGQTLQELLTDPDATIRIMAYEALRELDPDSMIIIPVGKNIGNFLLEIVQSDGPEMIYAYRARHRRIVLIGGDRMAFKPPLLYSETGKPVTINSKAGEKTITIIRKNYFGNIVVSPIKLGLSLPRAVEFMGNDPEKTRDGGLKGLGLDYTVILDVLYDLCEKKAINADFKWEEPSVEDLLGRPLAPVGRPESEL